MSVIVLVLGIVITGAGVGAIGFGVALNDLTLGHTLIMAGTTAIAGGLVLIGLAAAVAELAKIAHAVRSQPGRMARPGDVWPRAGGAVHEAPLDPRLEFRPREPHRTEPHRTEPPLPVEPRTPEPRPPEPRSLELRTHELRPVGDSTLEVSASAIERLRSSLGRPERSKADVPQQAPPFPNGSNGTYHAPEFLPDTNVAPVSKAVNGAAEFDASDEAGRDTHVDFLFRSNVTRAGQTESFDALWPKRPTRERDTAKPPAVGERLSNEPPEVLEIAAPLPAAQPSADADSTPAPMPLVAAQPMLQPNAPRTVGILKSGVVDGMAYTLYADGSIEAQLPQGTVRFGSIAELRAHIENNP